MDIREECLKVIEQSGVTAAFLAKSIGRDPSTLNKWLKGTRNVSEEFKVDLANKLRELRDIWMEIDI